MKLNQAMVRTMLTAGWLHGWHSLSLAGWSVIASLALGGTVGRGQDRVAVELPQPGATLQLIRLPRVNELAPTVTGDGGQTSGFHSVASYLGETEISLAVVKAALSQAAWDRYVQRVLSLTGTDDDPKWGQYRQRVREGSAEYPAIHLGVTEMLAICTWLETEAKVDGAGMDAEIENVSFRVPARMEWQFAARAVTALHERAEKLHFDRWVTYSQNLRGRIEDIQAKIGDTPNADSVADQQGLIALVDRALQRDDTRNEAAELLGEILQQSIGFEPNIGRIEEANLFPVVSDQPNAWGFQRMLGNAPEWVLTAESLDELESFWSELKQQVSAGATGLETLGEQKFGVLMGGHFISLANRPGKWVEFSIDGGQPVAASTRQPEPYTVEQSDGDTAIGVEDGRGGLRVLMVRSLKSDWLIPFRRKTFLAADAVNANAIAEQTLQTMREVLPGADFRQTAAMVEVYRTLSSAKSGLTDDDWRKTLQEVESIDFASTSDSSTPDKPSEGLTALLALSGGSKPESQEDEAPADSPADFFEIAQQLAAAESQAGN